MPRGSKPGERRGGRQLGTPNKKTVLRNAAVCAAALDPNISPRDFMLGLVRNSDLPLAERFAAAQAALPLVHPKLTSGHRTQNSLDAYGSGVAADNTKERPNSDARVPMTSLYASLENGRPYVLSILRIIVALLFLEHGLQKYFGFPSAGPPMTSLLYVQGAIEIVGGILLLVGAYTRVVAFILAS